MGGQINRPMFRSRARRIFAEVVVTFPILRRPERPIHKSPATVGTHVLQDVLHACRTKRTFVGTDARLG